MPESSNPKQFDSVLTALLANRFDSIVREMTNTLLRSARSSVISIARDFSCAICTSNDELLACAEGIAVHIFGVQNQAKAIKDAHPDMKEGDAFLDNDPYVGGSHAADHTFLMPVFFEGEHLFTAVAKAHQADIGNAQPTCYNPNCEDVYEEGALIFPAVKIQSNYKINQDIVRMCQRRIRVPLQWYGDFLAGLGAVRVAERRLKELCGKYGKEVVKNFIRDWMNYSEEQMLHAIEKLPKAVLKNTGVHDSFEPYLKEEVHFNVSMDIQPAEGRIEVDMRDNIDNLDCGLNLTEATVNSAVFAGIFNCIGSGVPKNSGAFRRVNILLREGSAFGKPSFPYSCSVATTNLADRLINCIGAAFAQLDDQSGLAEGGMGIGPGNAVLSGKEHRANDEAWVNQLVTSCNGGPASPVADGWVTYVVPVVNGLMYRDSVEIDELKMPIEFKHIRLRMGTGGAGKFRGGLSCDIQYGAKKNPVTIMYPCDTQYNAPKGVRGGHDGCNAIAWHIHCDGTEEKLPNNVRLEIKQGEYIRGFESSGGGYGDPLKRDPQRVLNDVLEYWETPERAFDVYGVVLVDDEDSEDLRIDKTATESLRRKKLERKCQ